MKHPAWIAAVAAGGLLCGAAAFSQSQTAVRAPAPLDFSPSPYRSADGRLTGWKVVIPGGRPLATPAVAEGKVFLGGGFGSHEFYALDAETGKRLWTYRTADDGPTAAVVADGKIAFNTESCELEVITTSGRPLWKKWLGDPLMSMPAIADGIVYMAYPNSRGDRKYYLAAFELGTGRELWKVALADEIITAPVIDGSSIFAATLDGTVLALNRVSGSVLWREQRNATSAPAVWKEQVFFSRREEVKGASTVQQTELVASRSVTRGGPAQDLRATQQSADYLDYRKRATSKAEMASQALDGTVGFAMSKGSAPMAASRANLGQASVHGIWAYQGSKVFIDRGRLYGSMGDRAQSVDPASGKVIWSRVLGGAVTEGVLTPPTIVNGKIFVASSAGELFALSARTGGILWKARLGESVSFQPAVVRGRVYVATNQGTLYCLNTNDARDDGWPMWGGSAGHNGPQRP